MPTIRQTSSYTMPVLSPRHTSSSLTGSYRSTSISRPYYNSTTGSYTAPRLNTYTERYTKTTTSYDDKKIYSRHSSISEESREKSLRRDSRSESSSRSIVSTVNMIDSVADLRNKYSPANYIPAVLRKSENISRSKSINDIGRPPIETKIIKTKKVNESGLLNDVACTNFTNKIDNNGNSSSVAEIRKKFDSNYKKKDPNNSEVLVGGNKLYSRPPKYIKVNDLNIQDNGSKNGDDMDTTELARPHHTTNFASFIPSKDFVCENSKDLNQIEESDKNDISTSPRLNRLQGTSNSLVRGSPGGPETSSVGRERSDRTSGLNGLKNIGNTCFMNSVIQCLSNTRHLLEYLQTDDYLEDINTTVSSMKGALIKAFSQVIQELWSSDSQDRVVNTVSLKSQIQRFAPRFIGYAQQDAQEFLRYLLEGLHEDVNRVTCKPPPLLTEIDEKLSDNQKAAEAWQRYLRLDNSRVVDIFVGQLKSTLRCTHCGHASVTFDPFWDLSLPIPQRQGPLRLSQCLEHFTREETLDGDEKPTCSKCKERRKCTKSFSIQKFPRILVIHLKRFSPTERFRGKLNLVIDFPLQGLDLSACAAQPGADCTYNLYAVSNHSGTTYSGHYTAYCKHPYQHQWHEYNDSRVSSISPKSVVSSEAYVLFYELGGQHSHL